MISTDLLLRYMKTFYGYGSDRVPYWFIGIEERDHDKTDFSINRRLEVWDNWTPSNPELVGLRDFYCARKGTDKPFFSDPVEEVVPFWKAIVDVLLALKGNDRPTAKDESDYQRTELGKADGENCLLDLFPLPCRSTAKDDWLYGTWEYTAPISYLQGQRRDYTKKVKPCRISFLHDKILACRPKLVVFCGSKQGAWERIAGRKVRPNDIIQCGPTTFACMYQPAAKSRGYTTDYVDFGKQLRERLKLEPVASADPPRDSGYLHYAPSSA